GALVPAEQGLRVALAGPQGNVSSTRTRADGSYAFVLHVKQPGEYHAMSDRAASAPLALRVVPKLVVGLVGSGARDSRFIFTARVVPANAGALAVNVARGQDVLVDRTFTGRVHIKLAAPRGRARALLARACESTRARLTVRATCLASRGEQGITGALRRPRLPGRSHRSDLDSRRGRHVHSRRTVRGVPQGGRVRPQSA